MPAKTHRRKTFRKNAKSNIRRQLKYLKKVTKPEYKNIYQDSSSLGQTIALQSTVGYFLNGIAEGVSDNQRVGKKVHLRKINMKFIFTPNTSPNPLLFRVIVMRVNDIDATAVQLTDFLTHTADDCSMVSFYNKSKAGQFKVYYDKVHVVPTTTVDRSVHIKKTLNFTSIYSGTGSNQTDLQRNGLYCFIVNSNAAALVEWHHFKLSYTDT